MSRLFSLPLVFAAICISTALACSSGDAPTMPSPGPDPVIAQAVHADSGGATLLAGFRVAIDPDTLTAIVTPHRTPTAQPPQGQRYDLDIANFQNADSFRVTGVQVLGSGNFRINFSHAHPFPAPNIANPATGTNRADLGYTGRLLLLTSYNPRSFFTNAVRLSAGAVIGPDGYVETGDLLAHAGPSLVTAYPYKLLADEALDNREGISNADNPIGNYAPSAGGWQRVNLGASGDGWTGYDYIHGGQTVANQFTLSKDALAATNYALDVALLIQYTDPRGSGGATHRLPAQVIDALDFAYRLPYAALDCSRVTPSANLIIAPTVGASTTLEVNVRDWDATATEAADSQVGDEADVALIQQDASGAPEVVLDAPGILTGLRNMGTPGTETGRSDDPLLYANSLPNQLGATAGTYYACLRITDPEFDDSARSSYHAGVDADTLLPSAARAIPARTWQIVPITIGPDVPVITSVTPNGIVGAVDEPITFTPGFTGSPTSWSWSFGGGARIASATDQSPATFLAGLPGTYTGTVTASNAGGTSAPFAFTYRVLDPQKPDFAFHTVAPTLLTISSQEGDHLLLLGDRPVLLFTNYSPSLRVDCAIAQVPIPDSPDDWVIHSPFTGDGGPLSAAVVNGRLAFMTTIFSPDVAPAYGYATVDLPASAADWELEPMMGVQLGSDNGGLANLVSINNRPVAVACNDTTDDLYAFVTSTATPTGPSDWTRYLVAADVTTLDLIVQTLPVGERAFLAVGREGVGDFRLYVAETASPASSTEWDPLFITDLGPQYIALSPGRVNAGSSEVYMAMVLSGSSQIYFHHFETAGPGNISILREADLGFQAFAFGEHPMTLATHNGRPAIAYRSASDGSVLLRARRSSPLLTDWEMVQLPVPIFMKRLSLGSVDNRIAVFGAANDIQFGLASGPW